MMPISLSISSYH